MLWPSSPTRTAPSVTGQDVVATDATAPAGVESGTPSPQSCAATASASASALTRRRSFAPRGMAQFGSAVASMAEGRWFKSSYPDLGAAGRSSRRQHTLRPGVFARAVPRAVRPGMPVLLSGEGHP